MSLAEKANFVLSLYLAHKQTQEGVDCFRRMQERIATGAYETDDATEREVSEMFHTEIEENGLGMHMISLAEKLKNLYAEVADICVHGEPNNLDFAFNEAQIKFIELLEEWQPINDACIAIDKKLQKLKRKQRTRRKE